MKTIFSLILLVSISVSAQTNYLRLVSGKVYDVRNTNGWNKITGKFLTQYEALTIVQVMTNKPVYETRWHDGYGTPGSYNSSASGYNRVRVGSEELPWKRVALANYSPGKIVAEGSQINTSAMLIGSVKFKDSVLEVWDCGTPYVPGTPVHPAPVKK